MSHNHEAAVACVDHPDLPATRVCLSCGRGFCEYCGDPPLVQRKKTRRPAVVCRHCVDKVRPWVWNPFAYGRDSAPGEHLTQALWSPRTAMMRAGYGSIPIGTLLLLVWLGCLGAAWIGVELSIGRDPEVVSFARFGYGIGWSLAGLAVLATFGACLHALQPAGPGRAATLAQTFQVAATAFAGPGIAAFCAGLVGFLAANLWHTWFGVVACGLCCLLAAGWGVLLAGWGMAVRRGGNPVLGLASALGSMVAVAILAGLAIWILLNPPWQTGWENTAF